MDDEEVEIFLNGLIDELRDSRFSELADVEEARRIDLEGDERPRRREPRYEALTILKGLRTQIALQHKGTVEGALQRLNEVLEKGQVTGALILSGTVGADSSALVADAFDMNELPDLSEELSELDTLIALITEPRATPL